MPPVRSPALAKHQMKTLWPSVWPAQHRTARAACRNTHRNTHHMWQAGWDLTVWQLTRLDSLYVGLQSYHLHQYQVNEFAQHVKRFLLQGQRLWSLGDLTVDKENCVAFREIVSSVNFPGVREIDLPIWRKKLPELQRHKFGFLTILLNRNIHT